VLSGFSSCPRFVSRIYSNNTGVLVDIESEFISITALARSSSAWGDYDRDGDLDLAVAGLTGGSGFPVTKIFQNDDGAFSSIGPGLTGVFDGSIAWTDYDSDDDLDLALSGFSIAGPVFAIYSNSTTSGSGAAPGPESSSSKLVSESFSSIGFSVPVYTTYENVPSTRIAIVRSGSLDDEVKILLVASNGTAAAGSDYSIVNSDLTFTEGMASNQFVITIHDDVLYEDEETIELQLIPVEKGSALHGLTNAVLSILEEDLDGDGLPDDWERASFDGLATDGSHDSDGDGMSDAQELVAGTEPTNAMSVFSLWVEHYGPHSDGVVISWPSVENRLYNLYVSTNRFDHVYEPVSTGLPAVPPMNVYTTWLDGARIYFYRLGVEK